VQAVAELVAQDDVADLLCGRVVAVAEQAEQVVDLVGGGVGRELTLEDATRNARVPTLSQLVEQCFCVHGSSVGVHRPIRPIV
jgi:hypothetical protein